MENLDAIELAPLEASSVSSASAGSSSVSPPRLSLGLPSKLFRRSKRFRSSSSPATVSSATVSTENLSINQSEVVDFPERYCWYCLKGQRRQIVIRPCKCKGYREFVHLRCLQKLISKKYLRCKRCYFRFPVEQKVVTLSQRFRSEGSSKTVRALRKDFCQIFLLLIWTLVICGLIAFIICQILQHQKENEILTILIVCMLPLSSVVFFSCCALCDSIQDCYIKYVKSRRTWELKTQVLLQNQQSDIIRETDV